ncbi:MAG: protease inhibitor I9 family protein, partial [Clostridia bacterium]|nr:protease inhibitor I9 family protein [Clostridia bacterium]
VTVIVEMKGDAVLEAKTAQEMGFKLFSETDEAAKIESDIKLTQAQLQSDIKQSIDGDAEIGYTYTHVLNGFSMEVYPSDIDAIKALPEV